MSEEKLHPKLWVHKDNYTHQLAQGPHQYLAAWLGNNGEDAAEYVPYVPESLLSAAESRVKELEEALQKYANHDNWCRTSYCNELHWDASIETKKNPKGQHPTAVAEQALAKVGKKEGE